MFNFLKGKKKSGEAPVTQEDAAPKGWFSRLSSGLKRTRERLSGGLANIILGKKQIDEALLEALETQLLLADVGVATTEKILTELTEQVDRKALTDPEALLLALKNLLLDILMPVEAPLILDTKPFVLLMVGVNGAGKTTSIAKLAHYYQAQNKKVLLAAGDTFRAAAVEQLQVWGDRNNVPVISQATGSDSASVIYDAFQATIARDYDLLIADTAGRLHTQSHLMQELEKIKRVMAKLNPAAPHETMLVVDASMGQNALHQAQQFHEAIGLTSIALTKLDGSAKGGIIFAIADTMKLPIRFIGVGEQIDDLRPFEAKAFIDALF